jgi:hypothetical protein
MTRSSLRRAAWLLALSFLPLWHQITALWSEIGCILDPHGSCGPELVQTEIGCGADPHGGCGQ